MNSPTNIDGVWFSNLIAYNLRFFICKAFGVGWNLNILRLSQFLLLLVAVTLAALPEDEPKSAREEIVCGISWFGKVACYGLNARGLLKADDKRVEAKRLP